jgi:hypothetical protein
VSCIYCYPNDCMCARTPIIGRTLSTTAYSLTAEKPAAVSVPPAEPDPVNHPKHYTAHPSGVECITVSEHFGFCLGNALKYIWRADLKNDAIEDLKKAKWYIEREIAKREREK